MFKISQRQQKSSIVSNPNCYLGNQVPGKTLEIYIIFGGEVRVLFWWVGSKHLNKNLKY